MRVELTDTVRDAMIKMSEGNPGAVTVLARLANDNPDLAALLICQLDDIGVYGPQIWIAFKDNCNSDLKEFTEAIIFRNKEKLLRCDRG